MKRHHLLFAFLVFINLCSCIEPYNTTIGDDASSLLVVDGLISNEETSYTINLTRSIANIDDEIISVTDAEVTIEDDLGGKVVLTETEDGVYITNPDEFVGVPGRTYTLEIKTKDGEQYQSEPCTMPQPSEIDEIYYEPENNSESLESNEFNGVTIHASGHINDDDVEHLRWAYEETWKFQVPFGPSEIPSACDEWETIVSKKYCWKNLSSNDILIQSFDNQTDKKVLGKELYFINTELTDKILMRYSSLIKQYTISSEEYDFWRKLEMTDPDPSNFFGEEPFSVTGNMKNIDDSDEQVLGYFMVAGCTTKRIYIDNSEFFDLDISMLDSYGTCSFDSLMLDDLNLDCIYDIYEEYVLSNKYGYDYAFPIIEGPISEKIIGLALTTPQCTDCTLEGDINEPDFWSETE